MYVCMQDQIYLTLQALKFVGRRFQKITQVEKNKY